MLPGSVLHARSNPDQKILPRVMHYGIIGKLLDNVTFHALVVVNLFLVIFIFIFIIAVIINAIIAAITVASL